MALNPDYAGTPRASAAIATTGDSSRTAPTNAVTVFTAGASGSRIERIVYAATGTTTATILRIFLYNGSTYYLYQEIQILANTPSSTAPVVEGSLEAFTTPNLMPIVIPTGWSLRASLNDTQTGVCVTAIGGDF